MTPNPAPVTTCDAEREALLPCPFCGAHRPDFERCIDGSTRHRISCTECPGGAEFFSSTEQQAAAAWNRRELTSPALRIDIKQATEQSGQQPKTSAPDLCYSTDEESYNYSDLHEVLTALDDQDALGVGSTFYEGEARRNAPSYYFDVDSLLEAMGERAYDDAGEWADTFPDLPKNKVAELDAIVKAWLDANLTATFYTVLNTRKVAVTAEMIAEYRGDSTSPQSEEGSLFLGVADGDAVDGKSGEKL